MKLLIALSLFAVTSAFTGTTPFLASRATTLSSTRRSAQQADRPFSPLTQWGDRIEDIRALQQKVKNTPLPDFAPEVSAKALGIAGDSQLQLQYFQKNAQAIREQMQKHGALVFRDFELMKDSEGFQQFYLAIGMKVCLDPLHSVSARPTVEKNSPVYEAVNKESRKNFFIGMHNEFVGTRAPRAAAFVCFKPAEEGGEFLIADGRRVFRDLDPNLVEELYNRQIRYSVMELPFFGWIDNLPGMIQEPVMGVVKGIVGAALNAKVDFDVELLWGQGGYDSTRMLQARAPAQPPVLLHPTTADPTWFCNVHSHSSKLRKQRESIYGAERFEDGASQINKSDMFYGDDGELTEEQLKHLDEVTWKNVRYVKMQLGDVVLLDNYKTMHGRNVFDGTRKHAVAWFEGWEGDDELKQKFQKEMSIAA